MGFLPAPIRTTKQEHIAAYFKPPGVESPFAGVGPADVHNRDPRELPLVSGVTNVVAGGVLAQANNANVVFCQLAPYRFIKPPEDLRTLAASDEDSLKGKQNLRKTFRRSSFLVTRLLANMGVRGQTPLLSHFSTPTGGIARASVIRNGDFRNDDDGDGTPDHWQLSSNLKQATCALETVAGPATVQPQCLRISCPEFDEREKESVMLAQYDLPVEKGQWYLISLKAKSEGLEGTRITLALQDTTAWRSLFDYQHFTPSETWKEFSFQVQANATATSKTRLQIWHGKAGTIWLSDVRMAPCDPPSQGRWTSGMYIDEPQVWDDPYRFFRW